MAKPKFKRGKVPEQVIDDVLYYHYDDLTKYLKERAYNQLFSLQNGKCAICWFPEDKKKLAMDHNHKTGCIRGLLCSKCNTMLGLAKDKDYILEKAAKYIDSKKAFSPRRFHE